MAISEFDLIARFFNRSGLAATSSEANVSLGIGDDCALVALPAGHQMALSMDVLLEGVHFPVAAPAALVAQRALRANLSDLAAMGATPLGFTLGLTLPDADEDWLQGFSDGLLACSQQFHCPLLGGNTTKGPLSIAIQVHGIVPEGKALTRSGAKPGDRVYVSGKLGAAAAALPLILGKAGEMPEITRKALLDAYYLPEPRIILGERLLTLASSCLDISDGLMGDIGHIAGSSGTGISLVSECIPINELALQAGSKEEALEQALSGGEDYELAFTVPPQHSDELAALARELNIPLTDIGTVVALDDWKPDDWKGDSEASRVECRDAQGRAVIPKTSGFRHF